MKKKEKAFVFISSMIDVFIVYLIQVFIVFMIIVIPSFIVLMKEVGNYEVPDIAFQALSPVSVKEIIMQNSLIKILTVIGACIALLCAPVLYENGKVGKEFKEQYLSGMKVNARQIFTGSFIGVAVFAAVYIGERIKDKVQISFHIESITDFGYLVFAFIGIVVFVLGNELFCRYYVKVKLEGNGQVFVFVVSNLLFIWFEYRNLSAVTITGFVNLCLYSLLLSLYMIRTRGISMGCGFRISYTFLSVMILKTDMLFGFESTYVSGKATGVLDSIFLSCVLAVLIAYGVLIVKKEG